MQLATLTAELASKQAMLTELAHQNETLRARERMLTRTVQEGAAEISELEHRLEAIGFEPAGGFGQRSGSGSSSAGGASRGTTSSAAAATGLAGSEGPAASGGSCSSSGAALTSGGASSGGGAGGGAEQQGVAGAGAGAGAGQGGGGAEFLEAMSDVSSSHSLASVLAAVMKLPGDQEVPQEVITTLRLVYKSMVEDATKVRRPISGALEQGPLCYQHNIKGSRCARGLSQAEVWDWQCVLLHSKQTQQVFKASAGMVCCQVFRHPLPPFGNNC